MENKQLESEATIYIKEIANELSITLSNQQVDNIASHLEYVLRMNQELNLTAINLLGEGLMLHVEDSLLPYRFFKNAPEGIYIDMGSGAGYPGIPLAIASNRKTKLIDSSMKKMKIIGEFLALRSLDKQIEVIPQRLEEYALDKYESCALATSRALATLPVVLELASPFLMQDGLLIVMKARPEESEIEAGNKVASIVGMELVDDVSMTLSDNKTLRRQFVYRKAGDSTIDLPRRNGLAQKRPLA